MCIALLVAAQVLCASLSDARAQTREYSTEHRPAEVEYVLRTSGPFTVIYQRGYDQAARQAASELHAERLATDSLISSPVQGRDLRLPVVLNAFNDRSNGYVRPFPFRTEIELPTLQSPDLIGGFETWTGIVGPHELVHAMHGDLQASFGVGRVLGWMGNDLERTLNLSVPSGWVEGVAVYRESRIVPGGGRLNAPRFTMRYRAAMESDDPWSLAQMLERPAFTQPFDRFYVGGAHAFTMLALEDRPASEDVFPRTAGFFNRFPFLGFGVALWHGAGERPGIIRDRLRRRAHETRRVRTADRSAPTTVGSAAGLSHRRPYWLDSKHVVATARGYNLRRGLYRIDVRTGERQRIAAQAVANDTEYTLAPDSSRVWTTRFVPDAFSSTQERMEVQPVTLKNGQRGERTERRRVRTPVEMPDGRLFAVRNDGPTTHIVERTSSGRFVQRTAYTNVRVLHMSASPSANVIAVLANVGGDHRIYRFGPGKDDDPSSFVLEPWFALPGLRLYDVSWGPDGRYMLVSAAAPSSSPTFPGQPPTAAETPNVYVLDTEKGAVTRQTDARYGAFEAALSPDRSTLAYIRYRHERYDLVVSDFDPTVPPVSADSVEHGTETWTGPGLLRTESEVPDIPWSEARPYRPRRHLAPRVLYPVVRDIDDASDIDELSAGDASPVGWGLGIQGTDPLQTWSYGAEAWMQDASLWSEASVQYAGIAPRPSLNLFRRPTLLGPGARLEEEGAGVGIDAPVTFASNVYQSVGRFGMDMEWRRTRLVRDGQAEGRVQRATLEPSATIGYRLQQNPRDLIPNSGLLFSGASTHDVWTDGADQQGVLGLVSAFVPLLSRWNTGIRLGAGVVSQRRGTEFGLGTFLPRGNEDFSLPSGTFVRWKGEILQPLAFVDNGLVTVPVYLKAVYAYGFGSTVTRASNVFGGGPRVSAIGAGLGARIRLFSVADFDLRLGLAYDVEDRGVTVVYR